MEGRSIQQCLPKSTTSTASSDNLIRSFSNFMFQGKIKAAMDLISKEGTGGILHLDDVIDGTNKTVLDVLKSKHPLAHSATSHSLVDCTIGSPMHPVIFEQIDASCIRSAALRMKGAAGPSGLDAYCWRRMCTSFKAASNDLCHSLALFAKRLATSFVDPNGLSAFLACRLIALDKCPGVRPIGICETVRRITAKAILSVTKLDLQEAVGSRQLCAGQIAGVEAAIHAMHNLFNNVDTDTVLLVDASNAFNTLNREAALHNIQYICPALAPALINTYRNATDLYVGGLTLLSEEGTTQGHVFTNYRYHSNNISNSLRL